MPNAATASAVSDKSPSSAAGGGPALSPVKDLQVEDVSMRKAYEDTELLKAIVVPLEEQVVDSRSRPFISFKNFQTCKEFFVLEE